MFSAIIGVGNMVELSTRENVQIQYLE